MDVIHDSQIKESNRLAIMKREDKIQKSNSEIADRTTSLLLQEAAATLSLKIIRLEDGPEGVIQHEDVITEEQRILFFKERYDTGGQLRSGNKFRQT